jgi:hypothetical protein
MFKTKDQAHPKIHAVLWATLADRFVTGTLWSPKISTIFLNTWQNIITGGHLCSADDK